MHAKMQFSKSLKNTNIVGKTFRLKVYDGGPAGIKLPPSYENLENLKVFFCIIRIPKNIAIINSPESSSSKKDDKIKMNFSGFNQNVLIINLFHLQHCVPLYNLMSHKTKGKVP